MQSNKLQPGRRRPRPRVIIIALCLVMLAAPVALLVAAVESSPAVEDSGTVDMDSAASANRLAGRLRAALTDRRTDRVSRVRVSAREINGLIALAGRGLPIFSGRVNVAPEGVAGAFTFQVTPGSFLGRHFFVNVTGMILPSRRGVEIDDFSVGDLPLPGPIARALLEYGMNLVFGSRIGSRILDAVESVTVEGSGLLLGLRPVPGLAQAMERAGRRAGSLRQGFDPIAAPGDVRAHYEALCELHDRIGGIVEAPLSYYLGHAIGTARMRTARSADPAAQNRAAILALAIFLGSARFDSVIGAIDPATLQRCQPGGGDIVLAGRSDLRLHFVYSAALEVIGNRDVSFAIGEFKELLDTRAGGSGFSFRDLAADRAGGRFAQLASSDAGARKVQRMAGEISNEAIFFPSVKDLPERIRREELENRGGLEGEYYRSHLALIERRIERLPLYQ